MHLPCSRTASATAAEELCPCRLHCLVRLPSRLPGVHLQTLRWPLQYNAFIGVDTVTAVTVCLPRNEIITAGRRDGRLDVYRLSDYEFVRNIGVKGIAAASLGLCACPASTDVLITDTAGNRVVQVDIREGQTQRVFGDGLLHQPTCVDCDAYSMVVTEAAVHRVSVLSLWDGTRTYFDASPLSRPRAVAFVSGGIAVADSDLGRVCVFTLKGVLIHSLTNLPGATAVVEVDCGASLIVVCAGAVDGGVIKRVSLASGEVTNEFGSRGGVVGQFAAGVGPSCAVLVPGKGRSGTGALIVDDSGNRRLQVFESGSE